MHDKDHHIFMASLLGMTTWHQGGVKKANKHSLALLLGTRFNLFLVTTLRDINIWHH